MSLGSFDPDTWRPLTRPLWPLHWTPSHRSPAPLIKFQIAHRLRPLTFSGSKKKEPRYVRLSITKALHSQKTRLRSPPIPPTFYTWNCPSAPLGGIIFSGCHVQYQAINYPVLHPIQEQYPNPTAGLGPHDHFLSLSLSAGKTLPCHMLVNKPALWTFFVIFCLKIPKASIGPTNWWIEPSFVSSLAISFPHISECPGTQKSPKEWWIMPGNFITKWLPCVASTKAKAWQSQI